MGCVPPEIPGRKRNTKTDWRAVLLVGLFILVMSPICGFIAWAAVLWRYAQSW